MTRSPFFISVGLLLALAAAGCRRAEPAQEDSPATVTGNSIRMPPDSPILKQVQCERAAVADLPTDEIVAPGKVEANPNRVSRVAAPVAGRVASVDVKVGDAVAVGQPLFTLDSPDADSAVSNERQAQAALVQAEAVLDKARADSERTTDLFEHDAVAKKDKLAADNAVTQADAGVAQARAALDQAQRRLGVLGLTTGGSKQRVTVRSPLAGKVLDLTIVPGEYRNDTSTPVMTIADLQTVWVSSQVPETSIRFIQPRELLEVRLAAYPADVFEARVQRIADTVDPQTRTVKVQAELANASGRLRPEMYGTIRHVESMVRTTVVPVAAVIDDNGQSVLFVQTGQGQFERRVVQAGRKADSVIRIASGVKPGEPVVVDGAVLLSALMRKG
ncbi:MAG TPA: efflux RND transporter periplasmic adaptor subunit [Vicinamibacterales bacterium]|jgi:cobalt-zinc-cadmium efflux system membrane fusion protein|nr:efflux RND transporter periplasmic adaptor subunit [Vicinamibacterales bacterium]